MNSNNDDTGLVIGMLVAVVIVIGPIVLFVWNARRTKPISFIAKGNVFKLVGVLILLLMIAGIYALFHLGGKNNCTHRYMFADGPHDVPCGSPLDEAMRGK